MKRVPALGCLSLAWLSLACKPAEPPRPVPAVRVVKAARLSGATGARYSATVEPQTRVNLAFKVGGYVARIAQRKSTGGASRILQEGDAVSRSEILAQLKAADFESQRGQAQASLGEASAALEKSTLDYGRAGKLRPGEDITQSDLDAARVAVDAARARVEGARARLSQATSALEDSTLRAPLDGTVTLRSVEVGTLVAPGTVAFSVVDTRTVKVVFGVPDTIVPRLKLGGRHTVAADGVPDRTFLGTLSRISPTADAKTRLFEAEVTLPNDDGALRPGMVATLVLDGPTGGGAEPSILVPLTAIVRSPLHPDAYAVFLVDGLVSGRDEPSAVRAREVTLGEFMGNDIPVLSGLSGDERIVVSGASLLSDGETVRVIP